MAIDWQFYHWHLEPSAICALKCPRCPRTEHPDTPWLNHSMDLNFFRSFMTVDMLTNHVKRITMCGDVGDPIYCREYIDIVEYIKNVNPRIHVITITNGSGKTAAWWQQLAAVTNQYDAVNFGIDGFDDASNNLYRVNSNWHSIMQGIQTLRKHNNQIFINWALIAFSFNQDRLADIQQMATDLGMDGLQITKSTKFGSKYGEHYKGQQDDLEPRSEWISSSHRYERHTINLSGRTPSIDNYITINRDRYIKIQQQYQNSPVVPLCEIGNRGLYVNAEGVLFPCSWTSFPYKTLSHGSKTIAWQDSFFAQYRQRMNLRNRPLTEILNDPLWSKCSQGWTDSNKTWVECAQKCQTHLVDEKYAVGWETN
jgi:MoaA/NifB/PqqE/SkfB family radical SAM enzyme